MANFKRLRFTNKETGTQFRVLDVKVTVVGDNLKEGLAVIVYSDKGNSIYLAMESEEFLATHVEGWLTKEDLNIEEVSTEEKTDEENEKSLVEMTREELAHEMFLGGFTEDLLEGKTKEELLDLLEVEDSDDEKED